MVPLMAPSDFQKLWLRSHSASADNSNQTSAVCRENVCSAADIINGYVQR